MTAVLFAAAAAALAVYGLLIPRVRPGGPPGVRPGGPPGVRAEAPGSGRAPSAVPANPLRLLYEEISRSGLALPLPAFLTCSAACGAAGLGLALPLQNGPVSAIACLLFGLAPYRLVRILGARRNRQINAAVGPALVQIGKLSDVRGHPFLALSDALPVLAPPLQDEFARALAETHAGDPLPDALRRLAQRCCDNFYLHQLAELTATSIRDGASLSRSLERLTARLRQTEELRAEEGVELFGYRWLNGLLLAAGLAPLPWWVLTGSPALQILTGEPLARWLLVWIVASGVTITSLPYWLAIDEG